VRKGVLNGRDETGAKLRAHRKQIWHAGKGRELLEPAKDRCVWLGYTAIHQAVIAEEKLNTLSGVYGDRHAGDPLEYDHVKLFYEDEVVEIAVYNRGICLFMGDNERLKRIHRVLVKIFLWGKDR
jgi:hypothetical protein